MKWINAALCGVLLAASGAALSSESVQESPTDYASGVVLETSGTSPWYRVSLLQTVYQSTAWPDLRDVRVFNHQGDTVPFALVAQKTRSVTPEAIALRLFPLDMSLAPPRDDARTGGESLVFRAKSGVEIHLQSDDVSAIGQSFY